MTTRPTLRQQAQAVELAAVNLRGHIDNLKNLITANKRARWELDHSLSYSPALDAAAKTLAWLERHEREIRTLIERKRAAA